MRTAFPAQKLSPSDEVIVELLPPADSGFSGTVLLYSVSQALMIAELLKRGYTQVERTEGARAAG